MDLDDFDAALSALPLDEEPLGRALTAKDAVEYIDMEWYASVSRRGRWMDLIGDYAGSEPFVVDGTSSYWARWVYIVSHVPLFILQGEALIGLVLDDPLLALGRKDGALIVESFLLGLPLMRYIGTDVSFQSIHAVYVLERILHDIFRRSDSFDIVFWHGMNAVLSVS